jgi:hypothetical protein
VEIWKKLVQNVEFFYHLEISHLRQANSWNGSLSNVSHFQFLISEFMICVVWLPVNTMECFWGFTIYFSLSNTPFSNQRLWKFCHRSGRWVCGLVSATGVIHCHQFHQLLLAIYLSLLLLPFGSLLLTT